MNSNNIAIIRDRYQITFPAVLRKFLNWIKPNNIIKITLLSREKVILEPYKKEKTINWAKIEKSLEKIRNSAGTKSLADFIIQDRESH